MPRYDFEIVNTRYGRLYRVFSHKDRGATIATCPDVTAAQRIVSTLDANDAFKQTIENNAQLISDLESEIRKKCGDINQLARDIEERDLIIEKLQKSFAAETTLRHNLHEALDELEDAIGIEK